MTDLRKAAEMALEILDMCFYDEDDKLFCLGGWHQEKFTDAREALRQALSQPEQEKYVTEVVAMHEDGTYTTKRTQIPKREWQGLTDENKVEIVKIVGITEEDDGWMVSQIFTLTEAKLKEKNT